MRNLAGLVQMRSQMRHHLGFVESRCELQIRRRGIDRIGVQNHQPIHLAGIHIRNQRLEVGNLIARQRNCGLMRDKNRLTHIAQRRVDRQCQDLDRRILIEPRNHSALTGVGLQILRKGGEELLLLVCPVVARSFSAIRTHSFRQLRRKRRNLARPQSQTMLGLESRRGRRGLDGIEPVQLLRILAPSGVIAHQFVEPRI